MKILIGFNGPNPDNGKIIVGLKCCSKVGKLLMGSTVQYVALKAHCPVSTGM